MGWSLSVYASDTLDRWQRKCEEQTGTNNVFIVNNKRYFFETTNQTRPDGAVTGDIFRYVDETHVVLDCHFRIEEDGTVSRGLEFLKQL